MFVLLGVAALASAVLIYAWALGKSRSPAAPVWMRGQLFASTICLIIVALAPFGTGFIAYGLGEPFTALSYAGLALLIASVPLLWLTVPHLARARGLSAADIVPMPVPPTSPEPGLPPQRMAA